MAKLGLPFAYSHPKIGAKLIFLGIGSSGDSSGFAQEYTYNQTGPWQLETKGWIFMSLMGLLFNPIALLCILRIVRPLPRWLWNRRKIAPTVDEVSNGGASGVPSETDDIPRVAI